MLIRVLFKSYFCSTLFLHFLLLSYFFYIFSPTFFLYFLLFLYFQSYFFLIFPYFYPTFSIFSVLLFSYVSYFYPIFSIFSVLLLSYFFIRVCCTACITTMIVHIAAFSNNSDSLVRIYALQDSQSDNTFLLDSFADELEPTSENMKL